MSEASKRMLFIVGTGRSGTSAYARLLGRHGRIAIGMERYIGMPAIKPIAEWDDDLFSKEKFFDPAFVPPASARKHYEEQEKKFDDALWVGDKVPSWILHVRELRDRYPNSTFLYMLREPRDVGLSWANRAQGAEKGFWLNKTFENGVLSCMKNFRRAKELLDSKIEGFHIIDFDRIFPFDLEYLAANLAILDLEIDDRIAEYYESSRTKAQTVAEKPRVLTEEQEEFVKKKVDRQLIQYLRDHGIMSKVAA